MALIITTGRISPKPTKHKPHLEPCPFCGSALIYLWDNEEEVKEALTKTLAEGEPRELLDYCAGIICQSCGANVEFCYGTDDWPIDPDNANEAREWVADSWNKRDKGISFFNFMMRYIKNDSPAGDLARDMERDNAHISNLNTREEIMSYLHGKGASNDCINTLIMCYKRYMHYRYKQEQYLKHKEEE